MKNSDVKTKVLNTAAQLFYKQGYNATGINQIIDESSIAKASLYNHFKSKTELLYAYLETLNTRWFEQLNDYLEKFTAPEDKILAIFDFRIQRQVSQEFGGCPFIKASAEVPVDDTRAFEIINRHKMNLRALILKLVQRIPQEQSILNHEQLTDTIYLLMEGATVTVNFQKNPQMLQKAKAVVERLL